MQGERPLWQDGGTGKMKRKAGEGKWKAVVMRGEAVETKWVARKARQDAGETTRKAKIAKREPGEMGPNLEITGRSRRQGMRRRSNGET